jgi:monooxygenase
VAEYFDVLIVGAGLSGIGAAHHLQKNCPGKTYAILEARATSGGTWDLFRYPGIRSDSDMYTLGYSFKPWREAKAIADGPSILSYIRDAAREGGIEKHIRYNHKVVRSDWSTLDGCWTVKVARGDTGEETEIKAGFVFMCSGYYRYDQGYMPDYEGVSNFKGRLIHPQHWPSDLDYAGKKVVVIGSGATAVTVVPEMAKTAAHVTMLQRSPTYVVARPDQDALANGLRKILPQKLAYSIIRWKNVLFGMYFYNVCRKTPEKAKDFILNGVKEEMGPDFDMAHFTPSYNPWEQRLCLVPNGDLFASIKAGTSSVVTDTIDTFVPQGIKLSSGKVLEADIVVSATGLNMQALGGMSVGVDGKDIKLGDTLAYKGMMFSGIPNLISFFGYTNASWTLKSDLTAEYVCRLLKHMDTTGMRQATPTGEVEEIELEPWLDFSSGYVTRAMHMFPKQAKNAPWKLHQNYAKDLMLLKYGKVDDEAMVFSNPAPVSKAA